MMRRTAIAVADDDPTPGIGHNLPPLAELLPEETVALRERADDLVASARDRATVASDDDAEKATLLVAMMRDHGAAIDKARVERKAPFLASCREVDAHFGALLLPLVGSDMKRKLSGAAGELLARVDAWRRHKEELAAAERRRLAEEAERQRRAAEESELRRLEAEERARRANSVAEREAARRQKAEAELERRQAEDRAAQADALAEAAAAPVIIRSGYGPKASGRTKRRAEIIDLRLAVRHCLKIDQHRIREAVEQIYAAQIRAGVRELPGAEIVEDSLTTIRK